MAAAADGAEVEPVEGLPPGFGDGLGRQGRLRHRRRLLGLPALRPPPTAPCRARWSAPCMSASCCCSASRCSPTCAPPRPPAKAWFWLLGVLGFATGLYNWVFYAADPPQRLPDHRRPRRRHGADRAGLRGGAAADGPAARHHRRHLPRLLLPRPAPAAAVHPSRLRLRADRRHFRLRHRGHLRHAGLCLGRLHLHLRRLRRLPRARRHDRAVQRCRARPRRLAGAAGRRRSACCPRR